MFLKMFFKNVFKTVDAPVYSVVKVPSYESEQPFSEFCKTDNHRHSYIPDLY